MSAYKPAFPIGSQVRIASLPQLQRFRATWKYHHPLTLEQLESADVLASVDKIGYYHGGDVLYELRDVPGIWHECCLSEIPRNE